MSRSGSDTGILYPPSPSRARRDRALWRAVGLIVVREVRRSLSGWQLPAAALVALTAVAGLLCCVLWFARESDVFVLTNPLLLPLQSVAAVGCLYVLFGAALRPLPARGQARPRSARKAAGNAASPAIAHLLTMVVLYGLLLLILIPPLLLMSWACNLVFPPALLWGLMTSLLGACLAASAGLFFAAVADSREAALALVAAAVVASLVIQGGHLVLASLSPSNPYRTILPLLHAGQQILPYVSPFAASAAMLEASLRSDQAHLLGLALATVLEIGLWLAATRVMLKRRSS